MDKLNKETFANELGIEYIPEENSLVASDGLEISDPIVDDIPTDLSEDVEYAKENIKGLIDNGISSLRDLLLTARASQTPRAYEVVATLLKTISELNKDLIEVHKRKADIEDQTGKTSTKINVDKAIVFSGSTTEFIKLIKKTTDDITS